MAFSFGTPKTATGFTLPTSSVTPTTGASLGATGDTKTPTTKPLGTLFGTPTTFSLGGLSTTPKTSAPTLSFGLGAATAATTATTSTPSFSISAPSSTATPTQFSLGTSLATSASTTSAPSFVLFSTATTTPSTAPKLGQGLQGLTPTTAAATTQASVVTTAAAPTLSAAGGLSYAQLEDSINKWTIDLEEQGKFFINQAKQLNAWDSLLVSNSDKIVTLNETIERIKQQQKQLDQELNFVLAQQNELDELSLPLEKQLNDVPVTDQSRFQTYQLAEIIDSQLKQMSEDLKEIVEHLNESNKDEDITDPVTQISRILNAHMNSLQWIDRNTSQISLHLEQVSQLHETYKKNHLNL